MSHLRILHFSDVHLPFPPGFFRTGEMLHPKRMIALVNFVLRRSGKYARGVQKLNGLADFLRREPVDYLLYTGDSLNQGLECEYMQAARRLAEVICLARRGGLAVPGNHDYYTSGAMAHYRRYMAPVLPSTDLPDATTESGFPLVRFMENSAVAIALNSSVPHVPFWDSSGRLDDAELASLGRLLKQERIVGRKHIFLMTHYPFLDTDALHGLRNSQPLFQLLKGHSNVVLLHGHNHRIYVRQAPELDIPVYCAGSLTKEGAESFWLFELFGGGLNPRQGVWKNARFVLRDPEAVEE
ncbi:MAG: metallophosphoesterase [Verrucomicrobiota bacterium]|jgi:3',5'-cyclic AMP phosphodiesterase CpdA|nr:metallophosphoesterase [Verrucomicrobiota bacterium]